MLGGFVLMILAIVDDMSEGKGCGIEMPPCRA